jgi:hypothetical protein
MRRCVRIWSGGRDEGGLPGFTRRVGVGDKDVVTVGCMREIEI